MTKILNFALKIKGAIGRVALAKSSATPPNLGRAHSLSIHYFRLPRKIVEIWEKLHQL